MWFFKKIHNIIIYHIRAQVVHIRTYCICIVSQCLCVYAIREICFCFCFCFASAFAFTSASELKYYIFKMVYASKKSKAIYSIRVRLNYCIQWWRVHKIEFCICCLVARNISLIYQIQKCNHSAWVRYTVSCRWIMYLYKDVI